MPRPLFIHLAKGRQPKVIGREDYIMKKPIFTCLLLAIGTMLFVSCASEKPETTTTTTTHETTVTQPAAATQQTTTVRSYR